MKKLAALLSLCFLSVATQIVQAKPNRDCLIVSGQSIGRLRLGMRLPVIRRIMGKPTTIGTLGKFDVEEWAANNGLYFTQVIYLHRKVVQVVTSWPKFKTQSGISTGSTASFIERHLKNPIKSSQDLWQARNEAMVQELYDYKKIGLSINFRFWGMSPERKDIFAITVHPKNQAVISDGFVWYYPTKHNTGVQVKEP